MSRWFFMGIALWLWVLFSLSNCSSESLDDFSPDPTCGRTISFQVSVSPAGAGSITRTEYVNSFGLNGLMPFQVFEFFASPTEGYQFVKWDLSPMSDREENPVSLIPCDINASVKTVKVTAIFELMVD